MSETREAINARRRRNRGYWVNEARCGNCGHRVTDINPNTGMQFYYCRRCRRRDSRRYYARKGKQSCDSGG